MEEALYTLLAADAGISTAMAANGNIYWVNRPQNKGLPSIVMTRISGDRGYVYSGPDPLVKSRVQFDCDAPTYLAAKTLARALLAKLSGFSNLGSGGWFHACFVDGGDRDTFDNTMATDQIFRTSVDYIIFHKEN